MQVARHHVSHDMPGMGSARGQMGAVPPVNSSNFISIFAGPVLMGFALWRSQSVPRWLAVLFFAGLELAQQQPSPITTGMTAAGTAPAYTTSPPNPEHGRAHQPAGRCPPPGRTATHPKSPSFWAIRPRSSLANRGTRQNTTICGERHGADDR